jgi:hypothetical protein
MSKTGLRILFLLFSSVAFEMPKKKSFFSKSVMLITYLPVPTELL